MRGIVILALTAAVLLPGPAQAGGVVGNGTPEACTESALDTALAGGGLVTFNCGTAAHPIVFSNQKTMPAGTTTIRGGGLISLSGGNATRLFSVPAGATLVLEHLVLTNGFAPLATQGGSGGAILVDGGALTLKSTIIRNSGTPLTGSQTGGAITSMSGTVTLTDSIIENNESDHGGGIHSVGIAPVLTLVDTIVRNNRARGESGAGGGLDVRGTTTIEGGAIEGNSAALGGGINAASGTLTITDAEILFNTAASNGGGIFNEGTLAMSGGALHVNSLGLEATEGGLGLYNGPAGVATLDEVVVTGHSISSGTFVAAMASHGQITVRNGIFFDNPGPAGAALHLRGLAEIVNSTISRSFAGVQVMEGSATLTSSTIFENDNVGLLVGGAATVTVENGTISRNGASGVAMLGAATVHLRSATVVDNGLTGGVQVATSETGTATFRNTIVSGTAPLCVVATGGQHVSEGFNIASDNNSCKFTAGGDRPGNNPLLGPLQNNGGPTRTHALLPGSPAIDGGTGAGCPPTDQRGITRPRGASCDVGAFEFGVLLATVELNQLAFETGDTIAYQGTVNPGFTPTAVDVYVGVFLPDRTFLSFVEEAPGIVTAVGGPAPIPFRANVVAEPLAVPFAYDFGGLEPPGTYLAYAGLAFPGANPFLPQSQFSVSIVPFVFTPSVPQ